MLTAAIHSECDLLVTEKTRDFPDESVEDADLLVITVDDALTSIAEEQREDIKEIVAAQIAALRRQRLAAKLTGTDQPTPPQLHAALTEALHDVLTTDDWGFPTARRLHAPDIELVKPVRGGRESIAHGPRSAPSHLFYMRATGSDWILVDLDGPDPAQSRTARP